MGTVWFAQLWRDVASLPVGWALFAIGVAGAVVGAAALVLVRHRAGLALGMIALTLAIASASLGALSVITTRARVDDDIAASATDAAGKPRTETWKQRTKRAGYESAKRGAQLGLIFAGAPLFAGLYAVLAPMVRRRAPRPMSVRMPRSIRSQAKHEWSTSRGSAAGLGLSGFAVLAVATGAVVWTLPIPGPAVAASDDAWDAREAIEIMRAGSLADGCEKLIESCRWRCSEDKVPDLVGASNECVHLRLDAFVEQRDVPTLSRLHEIKRSALPFGDVERAEVEKELDRVRNMEPGPVQPVPGE